MTAAEQGFLLLTCPMGNPDRQTLTVSQLRTLTARVQAMDPPWESRELELRDLTALGYGADMAQRILELLSEQELLEHYLHRAKCANCVPLTRITPGYPVALRKRLGADAPGSLWAKGDLSLLDRPVIALVGSRDISPTNRQFAAEVGRQAALQGYTLVSGNARGADRIAQEACLTAGGSVISIVADELGKQRPAERMLYLSEDGFDLPFTKLRALSRNRCIHALGSMVLVAQATAQKGGTWDGTVKNLRFGWSDVCCFDDGTDAPRILEQMGAQRIGMEELTALSSLQKEYRNLFDQ